MKYQSQPVVLRASVLEGRHRNIFSPIIVEHFWSPWLDLAASGWRSQPRLSSGRSCGAEQSSPSPFFCSASPMRWNTFEKFSRLALPTGFILWKILLIEMWAPNLSSDSSRLLLSTLIPFNILVRVFSFLPVFLFVSVFGPAESISLSSAQCTTLLFSVCCTWDTVSNSGSCKVTIILVRSLNCYQNFKNPYLSFL